MEWRVIEEFPIYSVSEDGQVMRTGQGRFGPTNKPLKGWPDAYGYRCYSFRKDGRKVNRKGYLLVAGAFIGPRPAPGMEVRHLDNTRTNDHWRNLKWGTRAENEADKIAAGTDNAGERHGMAKLKLPQVREIIALYGAGGISQREVAERYGVQQMTISLIVRGKYWARALERSV